MKENGLQEWCMVIWKYYGKVKELSYGKMMLENILEHGIKGKCMEMVHINGQMVDIMKGTTAMIWNMALGNFIGIEYFSILGEMEEYMRENGWMGNNMGKDYILTRMGSNARVVGLMEKEFTRFKNPFDFNLKYYSFNNLL